MLRVGQWLQRVTDGPRQVGPAADFFIAALSVALAGATAKVVKMICSVKDDVQNAGTSANKCWATPLLKK